MLALLPTMLLGDVAEQMTISLGPMMAIPMMEPSVGSQQQLSSLLAELKAQLSPRPAPTPLANPCAEDMKRLQCTDAACLKRSAESLAPACADMLLSKVEPSPAPMHRTRSSGYFSLMSSGPGGIERISGPLPSFSVRSVRVPNVANMPGFGSVLEMLPPELASIVSASMIEEEEMKEEQDHEPQHPCAREVNACVRETGSESRSAVEGCLVKHFTELSTECKCFVHHITNGRVDAAPAAAVSGMARATARPVVIGTVTTRPVAVDEVIIADRGMSSKIDHPAHRLTCLFVFTGLFLLTFLVLRSLITLLCCRGRVRTVVVVPPEEARIKTVGTTPPLLISELTTKPVQVAEPFAKA